MPPFQLIAEKIRCWFDRQRLQRYTLRSATERDLDFLMKETLEGAKRGHYAESLLDPEQARGFHDELVNIIHWETMARSTDRGNEEIIAQLWIYGRKNDDQVGYLLVSEKLPGSIDTAIELYKIGVREERRNFGHGGRIIQLFLKHVAPDVTLYARCRPSSNSMFRLLKRAGFVHINTMPLGTRELEMRR